MYPLSSLNDVSPTSLSDMKDLYGIFAVQACQSFMFLFFWGCMVCTPLINFMFIVNETKVEYKNSIFTTMHGKKLLNRILLSKIPTYQKPLSSPQINKQERTYNKKPSDQKAFNFINYLNRILLSKTSNRISSSNLM